MALATRQSLFDSGGDAPIVHSALWIERVILGDVALGLCVIAVAAIGAVMLGGRLPLRESMRTVLGLFVVLGAPVIASGFAGIIGETVEMSALQPFKVKHVDARPDLTPSNYDPYAGAALGNE